MPTCDIAIIIVCAGRHGTTERRAGAPGMNTKYENAEKIFKRCLYVGTEKKLAVTETALSYLFKCSVKKRDYVTANELNERLLYLQPNDERWRRNHELLEKKFKNL